MYRVLICDDEPNVIKSIMASVSWKSLQLEVVATASNGSSALHLIATQEIDIVIADITMPEMNGLELCQQLYKNCPHIQIILISGHASFAYAQKAIQYGVLGYCLKPIEEMEISNYLHKAIVNLDRKNNYSEDFCDTLISAIEDHDDVKIQHILAQKGINPQHLYISASVGSHSVVLDDPAIVLPIGKKSYYYITDIPVSTESLALIKEEGSILGFCSNIHPFTVKDIEKYFHKTLISAYGFFIDPIQRIKQIDKREIFNDTKLLAESYHTLNNKNVKVLRDVLFDFEDSHHVSIAFALKLCNLIFSHGTSTHDENEDKYIYHFDQLVDEYINFDNLIATLVESYSLDHVHECINMESSNLHFLNILKYINHNYANDISLKTIADALFLNSNYVSQMFKKEAGTTYTKYLINLRIDKAKELLTTTKLPISDICNQIGFNDYFYFLKTFKRITGVSPSKYIEFLETQVTIQP